MSVKVTIKDYREYLVFREQYYEDCLSVLEFNFEERIKTYNSLNWFLKLFAFKHTKGFEYHDEYYSLKVHLNHIQEELEFIWYQENQLGNSTVCFDNRAPKGFYSYWYNKENSNVQSTD